MKPAVLVAAALVLVGLGIAFAMVGSRDESSVEASALDYAGRRDFRTLEARVEELSRELDSVRMELAQVRARPAPIADAPATSPAAVLEAEPSQPTPLWYLEHYERSFEGGGGGSEYFRLAVSAYARELYEPIALRVKDAARHLFLRQRLVEILGDARFLGDSRVTAVLGWVIGSAPERDLVEEALSAFAIVGDARTLPILEREVWRISWEDLQQLAIEVVVDVAGEDANAALLRLMRGAPDDAQLIRLIALLRNSELVASLQAFELAARESQPVRLAAAFRVADFHGAPFHAFVDAWAAIERDAEVLAALGRAQQERHAVPDWGAAQATGAPDADVNRDDRRAWASRQADMGEQWLELGYAPALRASGVRITEVNAAGAVIGLLGIDAQGQRHELWSGLDPTTVPGVFELGFPTTDFAVSRLRIVLDTNRTPGWNEIDAVQLFGPDGSAWAASAVASSEYGQ